MTEKEFLTEFAKRYETLNLNYDINDNTRETFIDQFLKQIHHEYYEVEFVKKESIKGDAIELLNTMQDFKTKLDAS